MPLREMIRLQGKVLRMLLARPAATGEVIGGKLPLPVKRVLRTKMSCGRTRSPSPPFDSLNCVQVLTLPWVLIRIIIVKRVALGPGGLSPTGSGGQASSAAAGLGAAARPASRSAASSATAANSEIA